MGVPSLTCVPFAFGKVFAFGHGVCLRRIQCCFKSLAVIVAFSKSHGCAILSQRLPSATGFLAFGKTPGGVPLVHRLPSATGYFAFGKLG